MSGTAWDAELWFFGGVFNGESYTGTLLMGGNAGPLSVRVDWGSTGPNGVDPQVVTYQPEPDGQFYLPSNNGLRLYGDGTYQVRVTADMPGTQPSVSETLQLIIDLNGTTGVRRVGVSRDDLIAGGSGADTFVGLSGDDMLLGGAGNDRLDGGLGNDTLHGGGSGDETGADTLLGGGGDDKLQGGDGNDRLTGGTGNDEMSGDDGADTMLGDGGDDALFGGAGNDRLVGGTGADRFEGGAGGDALVSTLDGQVDRFVFAALTPGRDSISNFESGIDRIEIGFISAGQMSEARFLRSIGDMTDSGPYVIHDAGGVLYVDTNGISSGGRTSFATLGRGTQLEYSDLVFGA